MTLSPVLKILVLSLMLSAGCKNQSEKKVQSDSVTTIVHKDYELAFSPQDETLLILFPAFGTTSEFTKNEFNILDKASANGISVLMMNFNRNLWIDQEEMEYLSSLISSVVTENHLNAENIYIGGMSIGGNVSLSLSDYLIRTKSKLAPQGAFVIDSPIALYSLYESSLKDTKRSEFTDQRRAEPEWIVNYFEGQLGGKEGLLAAVERVGPITLKTQNIDNIEHLKNVKLRLYTEPDSLWWQENRQTDFESINAYSLRRISDLLNDKNWQNVSLIETQNKGYRSNGDRHPHSWSIVDVDDLIKWIIDR